VGIRGRLLVGSLCGNRRRITFVESPLTGLVRVSQRRTPIDARERSHIRVGTGFGVVLIVSIELRGGAVTMPNRIDNPLSGDLCALGMGTVVEELRLVWLQPVRRPCAFPIRAPMGVIKTFLLLSGTRHVG